MSKAKSPAVEAVKRAAPTNAELAECLRLVMQNVERLLRIVERQQQMIELMSKPRAKR